MKLLILLTVLGLMSRTNLKDQKNEIKSLSPLHINQTCKEIYIEKKPGWAKVYKEQCNSSFFYPQRDKEWKE